MALAERIGASWSTGYYWYPFRRRARNPLRWALYAWDILRTSAGLLKDARRLRATHVLIPEFSTVLRNAPALALLRLAGVRVIQRLGNARPRAFYRRLWRWGVGPFVDRFVCNSRFTERELLSHGIPGERFRSTTPCRRAFGARTSARRTRTEADLRGAGHPREGIDVRWTRSASSSTAGTTWARRGGRHGGRYRIPTPAT